MKKQPSAAALRPDLGPAAPAPLKRIRGEPHPFRASTPAPAFPPQHECAPRGPEDSYQASIDAQLRTIFRDYDITESPALRAALLKWRRA